MSAGPIRFAVRVTPRGGRDAVEGVTPDGALRVRVRAAPVDGAATTAVLRVVADALDVPVTRVTLESGAAARTKRLRVEGADADRVHARWPGLTVHV